MDKHKHQWQHYGVTYIETKWDEYSQKYLDSYIEHFRACLICGVIHRFDCSSKKWIIIPEQGE